MAALLLGFAYAGLRAHQRLADELAFADEGRDVRVTGIVDSLPVRLERGLRFEFEVESHEGTIGVPGRLLLGWYGTDHAGAAQWRFGSDGRVEFRSWRSRAARHWHNRPGAEQRTTVEAADEGLEEGDASQPFFGMP